MKNNCHVLLGIGFSMAIFLCSFNLSSQTYNMTNGSEITCSGTFYDNGGTGNYSNNQTLTYSFCPNNGSAISVDFLSFSIEAGFDSLLIYNGPDTDSPLLGVWWGTNSPGTITSTDPSGCLTFYFSSDGTVTNTGWEATISCAAPNYNMTDGGNTVTCLGTFYDNGGTSNYTNNQTLTHTFCPEDGSSLIANFLSFNIEAGFDSLLIYDGPNTDSPFLGVFWGTNNPGLITSTHPSGCLTFYFSSDGTVTNAGWEATLSCTGIVTGCIDLNACNFDITADADDGSCVYPGCTDVFACNYDSEAGCDSGSCSYDTDPCAGECINALGEGVDFSSNYSPVLWTQQFGTGNGIIDHTTGHLRIVGSNNDPDGEWGVLTQSIITVANSGTFSFDWDYYTVDGPQYDVAYYINGVRVDLTDVFGSISQGGSVSFEASLGDVIGFGIDATDGCCGWGELLITNFTHPLTVCGCTYSFACNYDPEAAVEDGSCEVSSCAGCTYPSAPEYDPLAMYDDGSCSCEAATCPGDFNGDLEVATQDLLSFLTFFGNSCE